MLNNKQNTHLQTIIKQNAHLQTIINTSPDIIVLKDAEGRWLEVNKRTLQIFGLEEQLYKGKTEQELGEIYPHFTQFVPHFIESDLQAWEAGQQIQVEEVVLIKGIEHIFEVIKIPIYDSLGKPDSLVVIGRDITERLRSEQWYKSIFTQHPDAVYSLDMDGKFLNTNEKAEQISGYSNEELLKMNFRSLVHPENLSMTMEGFHEVKEGHSRSSEIKIIRKDGTFRDISLTTIPAILREKVIGIHGIARDITKRKQSKAIREVQNNILAMIAEGTALSNILSKIVEFVELQSEGLCSIMLYEEEYNRLCVAYAPHLEESFVKQINGISVGLHQGACGHAAYTKKLKIIDDLETDPATEKWKKIVSIYGLRSCWSIPVLSSQGSVLGTFAVYYKEKRKPEDYEVELVKIFSYLTGLAIERNKYEQDIQYMITHDMLTDLPNLRYLKEASEKAIKVSSTEGQRLAVMFVDLDQFKPINDAFGHHYGDQVLQQIAKRIQDSLRKNDVVIRMGGDEFIILSQGMGDEANVYSLAERILQAIQQPIVIQNREFHVSASIGISLFPEHGNTIDILMKHADISMYDVKVNGGNSIKIYDSTMGERTYETFMLQRDFRKALNEKQFLLYYQPKVEIATGHVVGVEALVRWKHPEKGLISPAAFIPLAEANGFILELGSWVIQEACRQVKEWKELYNWDIRVAVNVSVRQFLQQDVVALVQQTLEQMDISPNSLEIEITESVLIKHEQLIQDALARLQKIGVRVAIDDFGTGYASLMYLKQFQSNAIKIDRSFIKSLPDNQDDVAIVSAVITLANELGMKVIAEGVETKEQSEFLLDKGCHEVQGYYYSPPIPSAQLYEFLKSAENQTRGTY